jgi:uncharacterized membrane protein
MAPNDVRLFTPIAGAKAAAPAIVTVAFVLFAAANMRTHIRRAIRHPMLLGLMLWSGVHLLSNGDLAGTILFGSFLAYSVIDLASVAARGAVKVFTPTLKHDSIAVVAGIGLAWIVMRFHGAFFGVPAIA